MPRKVYNVADAILRDTLAEIISERYDMWKQGRTKKEAEWSELRNYIFAVDTTTTSNSKLPWKNKTTRPKLCQIRDNLHANYMAALFPNDDWFTWLPADKTASEVEKRDAVVAYMKNKIRESNFKSTVSSLLYDYIDYGNVFADVEYVNERWAGKDGEEIIGYVGPRCFRVSPYDVVFDLTGTSFDEVPKITRSLVTFGELEKRRRTGDPSVAELSEKVLGQILQNRRDIMAFKPEDIRKSEGYTADGFDSLYTYYTSGFVELLEFEGDLYDLATGTLYENTIITVADRNYVVRNEPLSTWTGKSTKKHCGWRLRPDNLMAMGPLDNLVGLQYRIDHLENLKADVFDQIAHPIVKVRGAVEEFVWQPNERIFMDADADVELLKPEAIALSANFDIDRLLLEMEEMAGAPREAMGIRSPGEKTKFEVQVLQNAASRMFQQKLAYFEEQIIEPVLNSMFELARMNLDTKDTVSILDPDTGLTEFLDVTKDDLKARGRLVPMGARHFAAQAQLVQNIQGFVQSGLWQDPGIRSHLSGKALARLTVENLGLTKEGVYRENVAVEEDAETQTLAVAARQKVEEGAITPTTDSDDMINELEGRNLPDLPPEEQAGE